ncbi:type II secretion system protein GspL [Hyphomonas pacifica]|uniref:type II secretion system protein GspL n=1 Tax=Hyphomonas pacifica TaxID=1280941 RepID=UPI000DBF797A|nr:type II secretion system protein GspL [Hyphomonas pacifica]RAN33119.1 hypothetical protein HY11_16980 [Hyphomonas pacifica]
MQQSYYSEIPAAGSTWRFARSSTSGVELLPTGQMPPAGSELIVFVPGTEVTSHSVKIAARRPAELSRLAAFAVEDDLSVPVECIHAAVSSGPTQTGVRQVYAVSNDQMERWLEQVASLGFGKARLVPDLSLVPVGAFVDIGDRLLFATDEHAMAIDAVWPSDVIGALLKQAGVELEARRVDGLVQLSEWAEQTGKLTDLRQGRFAHASEAALPLKRFRPLALMTAALIAVWVTSLALSTHSMQNLTEILLAQAKANYAAAYPDSPVPSNPAATLRASQGTGVRDAIPAFIDTSAVLYGAVNSTPGANLISMRYDRQAGELRATLTYPAFGADLDVKRAIESVGLNVDLGDTRLEDGRVVGDLVIGAPS